MLVVGGNRPGRSAGAWPLLAAVLAACAFVASAWSQAPPAVAAPRTELTPEFRALDALFADLLRSEGDGLLTAPNLFELSRLLPDTCDQLCWLEAKVTGFAGDRARTRLAGQLATLAVEQLAGLMPPEAPSECDAWLQKLREIAETASRAPDYTELETLKAVLADSATLAGLDAWSRFVALAGGAPTAGVLPSNETPDWNVPRQLLDVLAEKPELPPYERLLDYAKLLREAGERWSTAAGEALPDEAQRQLVTDSFSIAAALLDRALGFDAEDVAAAPVTLAYANTPAAWSAVAERLHDARLRTWGTLAALLAASPAGGAPPARDLLTAAGAAWAEVRQIDKNVWLAVDEPRNGWLARLPDTTRAVQYRQMPWTRDFRAAALAQRKTFEERLPARVSALEAAGDEKTAEEALQNIQRAKAAEIGLTVEPIGLAELKQQLGSGNDQVYLYLEIIELRGSSPSTPVFDAVAICNREYREPMAGDTIANPYFAKLILRQGSVEDVLHVALSAPGPKLAGEQIPADARIIIAPDGPLSAEWFAAERRTLVEPTKWGTGTGQGWVTYTPSALALAPAEKARAWTLEATLRAWYPRAIRAGATLRAETLSAGAAGNPWRRTDLKLWRLWMGPYAASPNTLEALLAAKRDTARPAPLPVLPLGVAAQ